MARAMGCSVSERHLALGMGAPWCGSVGDAELHPGPSGGALTGLLQLVLQDDCCFCGRSDGRRGHTVSNDGCCVHCCIWLVPGGL